MAGLVPATQKRGAAEEIAAPTLRIIGAASFLGPRDKPGDDVMKTVRAYPFFSFLIASTSGRSASQ